MKTLVLIDGHSLAYRMHFALETTRMATSQKEPTWAIFGFFNALFALLKEVKPDCIAVSFDVGRYTFRNEMYEAYKAHRESMPDALRTQMARIREGVELLGIPIYELPGFEADDVIGTLSRQAAEDGLYVKILTGDQDSFQLVDDGRVEVLIPSRSPRENLKTYNSQGVMEKLGITPEQVTDFKGLKGDTSDNIPGVPGIGDKTAVKLLTEYKTLENLYDHLSELPPNKLRERLETFRDQAFLSKKLATIDRHSPIQVDVQACHLVIPDLNALLGFLKACEFKTFIQQSTTLLAPFLSEESRAELQAAVQNYAPPAPAPKASTRKSSKSANDSGQMGLLNLDAEASPSEGGGVALQESPARPLVAAEASTQESKILLEALANWRVDYTLVTEESQLTEMVARIQKTGIFSFDLETTGLDFFSVDIVGIAVSVSPVLSQYQRKAVNLLHVTDYPPTFPALSLREGFVLGDEPEITTYYIPLGHKDAPKQLPMETVLNALRPLLISEEVVKIVHNAKFEINMMLERDIPMGGLVFDTMLASYVKNPDRRHGLKQLAFDLLHHQMQEIDTLIGSGKKMITFDNVPVKEGSEYAACDAYATLELALYFLSTMPEETDHDLWTLFYEIENPLAPVLAQMEREGVSLDTPYLKTLSNELEVRLAALEKEVYILSGCEFNLNSPKQVGEVLFEKLQIPPLRKTPSKSGYSTDAKVLETLAEEYEVVRKLMDYRQLFKLRSTYIDNLPELINPKTGRIHTSFNQTVAATGRLSSSNPNLQNIPIRSDVGRLIRQAFVPAHQPGWSLLSADYSQIELRLLAHFSEDPHLLAAFNQGEDVHAATAALVFGIPVDQVTKEQRYRAKTVNFGVIYGQSAHGLSQQLKITRFEAQQFIDLYFAQYDHVKAYIESVKEGAHATGYVKTLCNRVRDLEEGLNSRIRGIREFSERAAFNTPLQGSAADLMKVAMIRVARRLKTEKLETRLILQVHDELVLEVPDAERETVSKLVEEAMTLDQPLRVPLVVDIHIGDSWMET